MELLKQITAASVHASLSALSHLDIAPHAGLVTDPTPFPKNATPPALSSAPRFCNAWPPFFLTNNITPDPRQHPLPDPNTHPASPPPKTAASRHWAGPPHLLGEVHPQCGKSLGAGAVHITNHTGWLTISGFCNSNHITFLWLLRSVVECTCVWIR